MKPSRSPQQIIDEQVRIWSHKQRHTRVTPKSHLPVITVSRSFGAQGNALGRMIGDLTGFDVWDRDLVHAVAEAAGGDVRIMESLDERRRRAIDDAVRGFLRGVDATNTQYFRALARVIRTIAEHGHAVVVGRGANYLMKDESALRIRLVAPFTWRVDRYAERLGMPLHKAREHVAQRDRERADFVAHYFRHDIARAEDYDLVLNAASFRVDTMARMVVESYEARFGIEVGLRTV